MEDVHAFMERYRAATAAFDLDAALALHRTPLALITRQRGWIVTRESELRDQLSQTFDFYRWSGVRAVEMGPLTTHGVEAGVTLAMTFWRALDGDGSEVAKFDVTHALGADAGERRIVGVVVHNEIFPRDKLAAEQLRALGEADAGKGT